MKQKLFTDITAYITSTNDPGVFIVGGRPAEGITLEEADQALNEYLYNFDGGVNFSRNLQKVKNKVESVLLHNEIKMEDRGAVLAISETIGSVEEFENDRDRYFSVSENDVFGIFKKEISLPQENTLFYRKKI